MKREPRKDEFGKGKSWWGVGERGGGRRQSREWSYQDFLWVTALLLLVFLSWVTAHSRWDPESWHSPLSYEGDALYFMAISKTYATGEVIPIFPKWVSRLGAPAGAQWNDYPTVEEPVFALSGLLVRVLGLAPGVNVSVLIAHLLAAVCFFAASRLRGHRRSFAFLGATLFATAPYIFRRSLVHLNLVHCWIVPLVVLVVLWSLSEQGLSLRRKLRLALGIAFIAGTLNPYYSVMMGELLVIASLVQMARKAWVQVARLCGVLGALVGGFLLVNLDTFYYAWQYGRNPGSVVRSIAGIENLALKPLDLFIPAAHRCRALTAWLYREYFGAVLVKGEIGSAYLGVVAGATLLLMILGTWWLYVRRPDWRPAPHLWLVLFLLMYGVVGGVSSALALFDFRLLRGGNRFSIFILAIVLLYLAGWLSRHCPRQYALPVVGILLAVGLWDQTPPAPSEVRQASIEARFSADRDFTHQMEAALDPGAMVFQLPVLRFPEVAAPGLMDSYSPLRPYLFSDSLRFSFGTHKGRGHEHWQVQVSKLPPDEMVTELQSAGFDAIWLDLQGYPGDGTGKVASLAAASGGYVIESSLSGTAAVIFPESGDDNES